jgi:hypothetical protein
MGSLSRLDQIDWAKYQHAFGPADDVPAFLRGLIASDAEQRWEALYHLMETVWHQGTVYEATSHVVPFLVQMLQSPQTPDPALVAFLLASIADGHSYLEVHAKPGSVMEVTWRQILRDKGQNLEEQLALELGWVEDVRRAVGPHIPLLYEFLGHEESEVRLSVSLALGKYSQHRVESIARLEAALEHEQDEYLREAIETSLAELESTTTDSA